MKSFQKNLTQFLISNNSWIFLVSLIFILYFRVLHFEMDRGFKMIYVHPTKWLLFLEHLGVCLLIFSPMILFTVFRKRIDAIESNWFHYSLWILVFILFPTSLGLLLFYQPQLSRYFSSEFAMIVGFGLTGVEIFTSPKARFHNRSVVENWQEKISVEWIVLAIFFAFSVMSSLSLVEMNRANGGFFLVWIQSVIVLSLYYLFYKGNQLFLFPIYKQKGVIYYGFAFIGLAAIFYLPILLAMHYMPAIRTVGTYVLGDQWVGEQAPNAFYAIHASAIPRFMLFTIPFVILIQWLKQSREISELEKEKSQTELSLLKQQINPHFFFNTLNNLYSMSLNNDAQTPESIMQLSELMRYVIYRGRENSVALQDEIKYIEDYIKLQKLRYHKDLDLVFDISIEDEDFQVPPLLFIILVENSFKHGVDPAEGDSYLHIELIQNNDHLKFVCKNSVELHHHAEDGVGLSNLRKRLDLLFPDAYELNLESDQDSYIAELTIKL